MTVQEEEDELSFHRYECDCNFPFLCVTGHSGVVEWLLWLFL